MPFSQGVKSTKLYLPKQIEIEIEKFSSKLEFFFFVFVSEFRPH